MIRILLRNVTNLLVAWETLCSVSLSPACIVHPEPCTSCVPRHTLHAYRASAYTAYPQPVVYIFSLYAVCVSAFTAHSWSAYRTPRVFTAGMPEIVLYTFDLYCTFSACIRVFLSRDCTPSSRNVGVS